MAKKENERGSHLGHIACSGCGSSDNKSVYLMKDGSHTFFCWGACSGKERFKAEEGFTLQEWTPREIDPAVEMAKLIDVKENLMAVDWPARMMGEDIYELYGVKFELEADGEDIKGLYYPTYEAGEHTGYRQRFKFESWMKQVKKKPELLGKIKNFNGGIGANKVGIEMYGQHLFPPGSSTRIIVTSGEEDAHAVYHMCSLHTKFGKGYPTVSVPSGENVSFVRPNIPYLSSFEEILIVFDNDKAGVAFQAELCKLLPIGKVKIIKLPKGIKDPSQLWTQTTSFEHRRRVSKEFYNSLFRAERFSPVGVKGLDEVWEEYKDLGDEVLIPLPECFGQLQYQTGGLELGAIHGIAAATSVGKTAFVGEIVYHTRVATDYNIGVCSAEDSAPEYLRTLISLHISDPLKEKTRGERNLEKEFEAKNWLKGESGNRFSILEHAGTADLEELLQKAEWMITVQDCKLIVLDPVTLLVGSESSSLDDFMSDILKLAKRHMVAFLLVFHTRKTKQGDSAASQGAEITIEDIKSSGSGGQVCASIMLLNRNKEHDNQIIKNTTTARWAKFRRKGSVTGLRDYLFYEVGTGRLKQGQNPVEILEAEAGDGGFDDDFSR